MKTTFLALLASGTVALAGPMGFGPAPTYDPPAPLGGGLLDNLFVAGSVGYLQESEEEMWHVQLGLDLQPKLAGMDQAVFLEVGYNELNFFNVEQTIVPVTLNYKVERPLTGPVSLYLGAGGGIAFYDVSGAVDSEDEVFWGQVFGGLVYNLSESFEIFGGLRAVFLDEVEINGFTTSSGDDLLWEIGGRFNF